MDSADKPFKTINEQLTILENRGMTVKFDDKHDYGKIILEREGYYNLINGYSKLFMDANNPGKYMVGTTIEDVYALYNLDRVLREVFFRYILQVETALKSQVSYVFSERFGNMNYLIYENFDTKQRNAKANISALIAQIQNQISYRCNDPVISHYLTTYGHIPLWVLTGILTIGEMSKFYSLMQQSDRQKVAKHFHLSDNELQNYFQYIAIVRNFCAHGNRLFCFRTSRPLLDTEAHNSLGIPKSENGEYLYGKRDLFACAIALSKLISKTNFTRMKRDISRALKYFGKKCSILQENDILQSMGFPEKWWTLSNK